MRDKDGWRLSQKQARQYLGAVKMLYGDPDKGSAEIVALRANTAVSTKPRVPRGTRKSTVPPEWREQAALVKWLKWQPYMRDHVINIRNEARRSPKQSNVAKMMGLRKGASDLFIARPHNGKCGLFLEMKENREYSEYEKRTETWIEQEKFIILMRQSGYDAHFAFGCDQGIILVRKYLGLIDK